MSEPPSSDARWLPRPAACEVEGCDRPPLVRRRWPTSEDRTWLCCRHNQRLIRRGTVEPTTARRPRIERQCNYDGCTELARRGSDGLLLRRCASHAGPMRPTPACGMPGCSQPVTRKPSTGGLNVRCSEHRGQFTPDHRDRILAGIAAARSR